MSLLGLQYIREGMRSPTSAAPVTYAKPKAVAMDYRSAGSEFSTGVAFDNSVNAAGTALNLHLKYPISILNMQVPQSAPGAAGYVFVQAMMAADAAHTAAQYVIPTQQYDSVSGGANYTAVWTALDAGGLTGGSWWAKNAATGLKTRTGQVASFTACEVNLCPAYTTADGSTPPRKAAEAIAYGLATQYLTNLYTAGIRAVFSDNWWGSPGSFTTSNTKDTANNDLGAGFVGDYTLDGVNDTRTNSDWATRNNVPNPEFRKGLANFSNTLKTIFPGLKVIGNADGDAVTDATFGNSCLGTTEFMTGSATGGKVVDYGYIEGLTAAAGSTNTSNMRSCIDAYRGNFANTINRYYTQHDGSAVGALVGCYVKTLTETASRTLQKCRYALGVSMLGDGYAAVSDRGLGAANMRPYWFDELDQPVGTASEVRPAAATGGYDGMWKRDYTNARVVVNPSANKGRWMQNAAGLNLINIRRLSGVVTLTWGTGTAISSMRTWVNGTTKVRLTDSTQIGGSPTFDGTFTITGNTANTLTWNDARADTALVNNPDGFLQTQSLVDLTGQGLHYFLGTQDLHNDYDGGTSQNDGSTVTTLKLWSGDAVLLLKS